MTRSTIFGVAVSALLALAGGPAQARGFTASDAYLAYLRLAAPQDLAGYLQDYRLHFAPPVGRPTNEFDAGSEDERLLATLKRNVAAFDPTEPFEMPLSLGFGDYDFGRKAFNFHPLNASNTFGAGGISVVFTNTRLFDGLPMEPDAARAFLERHPGRSVAATVAFLPVEAVEDTNRIKARIVSIELYSDDRRQNLIHVMRPDEGR